MQEDFDDVLFMEAWRRSCCLGKKIYDIVRTAQGKGNEMVDLIRTGGLGIFEAVFQEHLFFGLVRDVADGGGVAFDADVGYGSVGENGTGRAGMIRIYAVYFARA